MQCQPFNVYRFSLLQRTFPRRTNEIKFEKERMIHSVRLTFILAWKRRRSAPIPNVHGIGKMAQQKTAYYGATMAESAIYSYAAHKMI